MKISPLVWFALFSLSALRLAAADGPATVALSGPALAAAQTNIRRGDRRQSEALAFLLHGADELLKLRPASVMDLGPAGSGEDPHDYISLAPYWWPDPGKPGGLPYVQRDGKLNPESRRHTDAEAFVRTCGAARTLGLAYWFTGDQRYAAKAAALLRVWFLDPATRMNPNLEHAQAIRGVNTGRGIGLIEGRNLIDLVDGLGLIAGAAAWPEQDAAGMRAWVAGYYQWLVASSHGHDESHEENNHGSWYDAQAAGLALFLGRTDDVKQLVAKAKTKRIAVQIEPDGSQPLELKRTRSLNYVLFNLEALSTLARFGDQVGEDLWGFSTPDGRSLKAAVAAVAPFADPARRWPKDDLDKVNRRRILPLLIEADRHQPDPRFQALLARFALKPTPGEIWQLEWAGR